MSDSRESRFKTGRVRYAVLGVAGLTAAAGTVMVLASAGVSAAPAAQAPAGKVSLCHATDADTNPYVSITISANAVINAGHGDHTGPIWDDTLKDNGIKWGDIIPPFDYGKNGANHFPGLNWTAQGQAILRAGCVVVEAPPSESNPPTDTTVPSQSIEPSESLEPSESIDETTSTAVDNTTPATGPIPAGVDAGLHTPLANAGLRAWGIVLMLLGGAVGLVYGLWPTTRRRVH